MKRFPLINLVVAFSMLTTTAWAEEETATADEVVPVESTVRAKPERPTDPDSPAIVRAPVTPKFRSFWYLDAGLGFSDFDDPVLSISSTAGPVSSNFSGSGDDVALRILGGYQVNPYFAVESGLVGFGGEYREDFIITGTPTTTGTLQFRGIETQVNVPSTLLSSPVDSIELTSSISGLTFAAVGSIPASEKVTLHAKAGVLFWSEYLRVRTGSFRVRSEDDESATDLFAGIGFRYQFNPRIGFGFDAEHFELGSNSANVFSGMVRITFGRKKPTQKRRRMEAPDDLP